MEYQLRYVLSVLCLLCLAALVACGNPDATPEAETPSPTPTAQESARDESVVSASESPAEQPTDAFDAEAYFRGKTINILVGYAAGGGTDAQARFMAANLGRFIPGNPRITVSNLTPAVAAHNRLAASEPDGLTLQFIAGTQITASFEPQSEYRAWENSIIGAPQKGNPGWAILGSMPYQTVEDAIGATGPVITETITGNPRELTGTPLGVALVSDWLNIPLRLNVVAETGTAQSLMMLERGDVNSFIMTPGSTWFTLPERRPGWFADGFLRPFADLTTPGLSIPPNSEISFDAPNVREFLNEEQERFFIAASSPDVIVQKHLAAPPNMDPNVLRTLREAWEASLADPEYAAEFERVLGSPLDPMSGEEAQQLFTQTAMEYQQILPELEGVQDRLFAKFTQGG